MVRVGGAAMRITVSGLPVYLTDDATKIVVKTYIEHRLYLHWREEFGPVPHVEAIELHDDVTNEGYARIDIEPDDPEHIDMSGVKLTVVLCFGIWSAMMGFEPPKWRVADTEH